MMPDTTEDAPALAVVHSISALPSNESFLKLLSLSNYQGAPFALRSKNVDQIFAPTFLAIRAFYLTKTNAPYLVLPERF